MVPLERRIVLIEKNKPTIDYLEGEMSRYGVAVHSKLVNRRTTPEEVAAFVREVDPQLVLLAENYTGGEETFDILEIRLKLSESDPLTKKLQFKKGEGIETLRKIKEMYPKLPVYMISASPEHREEAMNSGANGYVGTTPQPQEVIKLLEKHTIEPT